MAAKIENVEFKDEMLIGSQKFVLNGVGLRSKKKLGMDFKVYVAGFYAMAKSSDASALIASPQPKILEIVFLRSLDRETLQEAWTEAFTNNCAEDCAAAQGQLKAFNDLMVDMNENSRMKISFEKGSVNVEVKGAKTQSAMIVGDAFRRAVLAIFIGPKPPTPELKAGLLGI